MYIPVVRDYYFTFVYSQLFIHKQTDKFLLLMKYRFLFIIALFFDPQDPNPAFIFFIIQ